MHAAPSGHRSGPQSSVQERNRTPVPWHHWPTKSVVSLIRPSFDLEALNYVNWHNFRHFLLDSSAQQTCWLRWINGAVTVMQDFAMSNLPVVYWRTVRDDHACNGRLLSIKGWFDHTDKLMTLLPQQNVFVFKVATVNHNCCSDNFTCYGDNFYCCGNKSYCSWNDWNCHHSNCGMLRLYYQYDLLRQQIHFLHEVIFKVNRV